MAKGLSRRQVMVAGTAAAFGLASSRLRAETGTRSSSLLVPLDHGRPSNGGFPLGYEWVPGNASGAPVVIVVADGQQFYARPGAAARLQKELFGPRFSVLVPFGRARSREIARLTGTGPATDWALAYRLLNRDQWLGDLRQLVSSLQLRGSPLYLYGRSGGAYLIYEWLVRDAQAADRIYVQAAVNPELDVRWGISADRTWSDLTAADSKIAGELLDRIRKDPRQRATIVRLLQRQNFFVPVEQTASERTALVRAFLDRDSDALARYRSDYQLDALDAMKDMPEAVASTVRLFEFAAPRSDPRTDINRLHPDVEMLFNEAQPLVDLARQNRIAYESRDWSLLSRQRGDVLQVAGRFDHTADYRTQIGLEAAVPRGRLLIFRDDHRLTKLERSGQQSSLVQTFMAGGSASADLEGVLARLSPLLWTKGETAEVSAVVSQEAQGAP